MSGEEPAPGPALRTAPPTSYHADHLVALSLLLALAGFLGVGIAYGTILGPISIAFNDPLHTNPVTSAGVVVNALRSERILPVLRAVCQES